MEAGGGAAEPDPIIGRELGPYRLVARLGRGGFGSVYRARHLNLGIDRAVKVMNAAVDQEEYKERFLHEAQMAVRMEHPHIVPVYDYGLEGDVQYIVMALVEADTLEKRLASGVPITTSEAARIALDLGAALDYAHSSRIVHRDVKPANVLIRHADGKVMLTDFGIARIMKDPGLTASGIAVGTFAYMSPEQVRGAVHELDGRSDIYSFSVMLFELVTGKAPFGTGPAAAVGHLSKAPPRVGSVNPYLPSALDAVLGRGLAKAAEERWPSAGALAGAFASVLESNASTANASFLQVGDTSTALSGHDLRRPTPSEELAAAVSEARTAGDRGGLASLLDRAGKRALDAGDLELARTSWEESVSIFRSLGSTQRVAETVFELGVVVDRMGRYPVARDYWEESIALWRSMDKPRALAARLLERGGYGLAHGQLDQARDDCIEALEIFVQTDNAGGASRALFNLAIVEERNGDQDLAQRLLAEAMARWADPASPDLKARSSFHLGRLSEQAGHARAAGRLWLASLEEWHRVGNARWTADVLARLSKLHLAQSNAVAALKLGGAASVLFSGMALDALADATRNELVGAAESLPEKAVWQAWSEGCAMDADGAVKFAAQLTANPR
jgi:tetratricopeptide (TPR) repeat protein/tRNA A-37 threonylcarbamoyl transferase component Bud32